LTTTKAKFVEPLIARLKSLISTLFARYFKAVDSYHRLNITNGNLYRENEMLSKINSKLKSENENLRSEVKDYKLLRKVFGNKQIDDLLERARSEKRSKQRGERFRNDKNER
jgi:cell division protein FtsB